MQQLLLSSIVILHISTPGAICKMLFFTKYIAFFVCIMYNEFVENVLFCFILLLKTANSAELSISRNVTGYSLSIVSRVMNQNHAASNAQHIMEVYLDGD